MRVLVSHEERPVPLEEIDIQRLPDRAASNVRGWWPRHITNALARRIWGRCCSLRPARNAAEELAQQLASAPPLDRFAPAYPGAGATRGHAAFQAAEAACRLPSQRPVVRTAGAVVEPLAKAGQLRVVVATMGLAAGINFSMRSVAITGTSYRAGHFEKQVLPDELLQMYGRAGRRGLDEVGYALVTPQPPRLHDARPRQFAARRWWTGRR